MALHNNLPRLKFVNLLAEEKNLEGKYNNFQEQDFLRDLKIAPFFSRYVAPEKRARSSNPVKNCALEICPDILFTSGHFAIKMVVRKTLKNEIDLSVHRLQTNVP